MDKSSSPTKREELENCDEQIEEIK